MLSFKKAAKRQISPANIQLQLGESPPLYHSDTRKLHSISPQKQRESRKLHSISPQKRRESRKLHSISPQKRRESRKAYSISPHQQREPKVYTSHYIREKINEYYQPVISQKPKIGLIKKIGMATKNLKKELQRFVFPKAANVNLQLGKSSSSTSSPKKVGDLRIKDELKRLGVK